MMITEEKTVFSGKLGDYAAAAEAQPDWAVDVVRSADNSRLTVKLVDPDGSLREVVVEIAGDAPQVIAYGQGSDEPLFIAKVGHDAALLSQNVQDPSGYDYIRFDADGMNRTHASSLDESSPALKV